MKFDEELETPRSAIVGNYPNVVPKTIRTPSRHKRTAEIKTGNFSGRTNEKEKSVLIREELEQKFQTVELQQSEMIFETNHFVFDEPKISCYQIELYIQCNKVEQPALRINIISGLQKLRCNSLTYIPATEKRLDFVQRGVNKELPPYSYKTPRKRKPPDKISFTIRGLD